MATPRQRFFNRLAGKDDRPALFVPDLSSWYQAHRIDVAHGAAQKYGPGELTPEADPMHLLPGTMPERYRGLTHLGLHRALGCPIPVHNYRWLETAFDGVEYVQTAADALKVETWRTPHGTLARRSRLAVDDGSWAIAQFPVKSVDDFDALIDIHVRARCGIARGQVERLAAEIGEDGFQDIVLTRSPVGALVHDYIGMERFVFMLFDERAAVEGLLESIEEPFLDVVRLAAATPARVVILGDNLDEHLIAPPVFEEFGLPYYRKVADILHGAGKVFSCHMDGNIKRLLPFFRDSGLDLYDGCTPLPMNNYGLDDLRDGLGDGMHAFCGVPSTLFAQNVRDEVILDFARRIIDTLGEKAILNIGDILPINGRIEPVEKIARMVNAL